MFGVRLPFWIFLALPGVPEPEYVVVRLVVLALTGCARLASLLLSGVVVHLRPLVHIPRLAGLPGQLCLSLPGHHPRA